MNYWKVYYAVDGKVLTAFAGAPGSWNADRVQRTMRTQKDVAGSVLVEAAEGLNAGEKVRFDLTITT